MVDWKLENDVNYYVKDQLDKISLKKLIDYNDESSMSDYMKEALKGSAKTKNKTRFGTPDFHVEKYKIPVIIENKLNLKKLKAENKSGIKFDDISISNFAVNGALYYAQNMIKSNKYDEVIAIGIAGNNSETVEIEVYYVFGSAKDTFKLIEKYNTLNFLESQTTFDYFYKSAILTEEEKHEILIESRDSLRKYAKKLNRLMHNHNVTAPQRVLYVSGMLLAMQDVLDERGNVIQAGLIPDDLTGKVTDSKRDGKLILEQIEEFLKMKNIESDKMKLMLSSFSEISKDKQRDEKIVLDKEVSKLLKENSSTNKQIFTFIYENIFKSIDAITNHIDIMGEMYSEFLKYAFGDGKELGIVLTPPYVTKMMAEILDISPENKVMDLATGSAGFLISAMEIMIEQAELKYGKGTIEAKKRIDNIKKENLLGVELNAEMYTLAATNMILRGDGSSNIKKGNTFDTPEELYEEFKADRLLLNPPFSYKENGMPFIKFGLDRMGKGGLGAIIIQDSAGTGKAAITNKEILKAHTLLGSIKMPVDLFEPMAGVQTSIYIFEAKKPHDFEKTVKFIDFSNDGYKRTARSITPKDSPIERYRDIIKIYKAGKNAQIDNKLWKIDEVFVEDFITNNGNDWNFNQHIKIDIVPEVTDFKNSVKDYLDWEVKKVLEKKVKNESIINTRLLEEQFIENGGVFKEVLIGDLFKIESNPQLDKKHFKFTTEDKGYPYFTRTVLNNGISGYVEYIGEKNLIKGNSIAIGMLGMQAFYMKRDFYAGQFTKNIIPKFNGFNEEVALYFITMFNKLQKLLQSSLVRDFEEIISDTVVTVPIKNEELAIEYIEKYINMMKNICVEDIKLNHDELMDIYKSFIKQ